MSEVKLIEWSELKLFLKDHVPTTHYTKIIQKIEKAIERVNDADLLQEYYKKCKFSIETEPEKNFVFIKKLIDTIKLNRTKINPISKSARGTIQPSSKDLVHPTIIKNDIDKPGPSGLNNNSLSIEPITIDSDESSDKTDSSIPSMNVEPVLQPASSNQLDFLDPDSRKRRLKIRRLEELLEKTKTKIRQLEEAEIQLDKLDDDDSQYIQVDKFKNLAIRVWKQIRVLENQSMHTGRLTKKRFRFCGSNYSELNEFITKLVNVRGEINFPDFRDIFKCVETFNNTEKKNWTPSEVHQEAVHNFRKLIDRLQSIRKEDFFKDFGCHLTDIPMDDPYDTNHELRKKLNRSKEEGIKKLDEVLDKYTKLKESDMSEDQKSATEEYSTDDNSSGEQKVKTFDSETLPPQSADIDVKPTMSKPELKMKPKIRQSCDMDSPTLSANSRREKRKSEFCDQDVKREKLRRVEFFTIDTKNESLSTTCAENHSKSQSGTNGIHGFPVINPSSQDNGSAASSPSSHSSQLAIDLEAPVKMEIVAAVPSSKKKKEIGKSSKEPIVID